MEETYTATTPSVVNASGPDGMRLRYIHTGGGSETMYFFDPQGSVVSRKEVFKLRYDDMELEILKALSWVGVDSMLGEGDAFFRNIVENFDGTDEECLAYIRKNAPTWFRSVGNPPEWIQSAEWQYWKGNPMVFVGQIDTLVSSDLFPDVVSFYVFYDPETGVTETVSQTS